MHKVVVRTKRLGEACHLPWALPLPCVCRQCRRCACTKGWTGGTNRVQRRALPHMLRCAAHAAAGNSRCLPARSPTRCAFAAAGGGFGGKESRSGFINAAAAVPAYHLRRAVRCAGPRTEDRRRSGTEGAEASLPAASLPMASCSQPAVLGLVARAAVAPAWFVTCRGACAALAAARRIVLDRDEDMQITGQRHAFMGRYRVRVRECACVCGGGGAVGGLPSAVRARMLAPTPLPRCRLVGPPPPLLSSLPHACLKPLHPTHPTHSHPPPTPLHPPPGGLHSRGAAAGAGPAPVQQRRQLAGPQASLRAPAWGRVTGGRTGRQGGT